MCPSSSVGERSPSGEDFDPINVASSIQNPTPLHQRSNISDGATRAPLTRRRWLLELNSVCVKQSGKTLEAGCCGCNLVDQLPMTLWLKCSRTRTAGSGSQHTICPMQLKLFPQGSPKCPTPRPVTGERGHRVLVYRADPLCPYSVMVPRHWQRTVNRGRRSRQHRPWEK